MATYRSGNVQRATPNTIKSMKRSAAKRCCPKCGRKSAVRSELQGWGDQIVIVRWCRWKFEAPPLCSYEEVCR